MEGVGCKLMHYSQAGHKKASYHTASAIKVQILLKPNHILADSPSHFHVPKKKMEEIKAFFLVSRATQYIALTLCNLCKETDEGNMQTNISTKTTAKSQWKYTAF